MAPKHPQQPGLSGCWPACDPLIPCQGGFIFQMAQRQEADRGALGVCVSGCGFSQGPSSSPSAGTHRHPGSPCSTSSASRSGCCRLWKVRAGVANVAPTTLLAPTLPAALLFLGSPQYLFSSAAWIETLYREMGPCLRLRSQKLCLAANLNKQM